MLSFWEKNIVSDVDFLVVGAGIIGMSVALELRSKYPRSRIAVLERGAFGAGASSRNAGFACYGSLTEVLADIDSIGAEATRGLVAERVEGLRILRERVSDDSLRYEGLGGFELLFRDRAAAGLQRLEEANELLAPIFGGANPFVRVTETVDNFRFGSSVADCISLPFEGQIHSGTMMQTLYRLAIEKNVNLIFGAEVLDIADNGRAAETSVRFAPYADVESVSAARAIVCANAVVGEFFPETGIAPGRGQIFITEEISDLPFRGVFHFNEGYFYFRNVGKRILFGGGRNHALAEEQTFEFGMSNTIQQVLETALQSIIAPTIPNIRIDRRWSGIMGFSPTKLPVTRFVSPNVAVGFGCNGMGISLGSLVAKRVVDLM